MNAEPDAASATDILAANGIAIRDEAERAEALAGIAGMRQLAAMLYAVPEARYVDPAITWSAVAD